MVPIQTIITSASATSVLFSSIPQKYSHLMIQAISKDSRAYPYADIYLTINGDTGANYSYLGFLNNQGTTQNVTSNNNSSVWAAGSAGNDANSGANEFGNHRWFIPNYRGSTFKNVSGESTTGNSGTTGFTTFAGGTWKNTAAITSITLTPITTPWALNSEFTLYGFGRIA